MAPVSRGKRGYQVAVDAGRICAGTKKSGVRCGWIVGKPGDYCHVHNPNITDEQRWAHVRKPHRPRILTGPKGGTRTIKTVEDVLELISQRLDGYIACWGATTTPETEQTICELIRTFVQVKKCSTDSEALDAAGWSMKRRQA